MSREDDLARIADRPGVERARALIDAEIAAVEDAERKRQFAAIRDGTATGETALNGWMRLEALDAVRRNLVRQEKRAVNAGHRRKGDMEGTG